MSSKVSQPAERSAPGASPWPPEGGGDRLARMLTYILFAGGALYLAFAIGVPLARLGYPFELEWMEGGTLDHVRRVLAGLPLYVPPTPDFVPFIYTPLYDWAAAGMTRLTGGGFLPLRLVSFLSFLGALALLFRLVRRETASPRAGFLAAALFAATYALSGGWFDLARTDSLALCLILAAVDLARARSHPAAQAIAGLLGALAFLAKQSALVVLAPVVAERLATALLDRRSGRGGIAFAAGCVIPAAAAAAVLNGASGGWFAYYVFRLPGGHPIMPQEIYYYWTRDLLAPLGIACAIGAAAVLVRAERSPAPPERTPGRAAPATSGGAGPVAPLLAALACGLLLSSWFSRIHAGGARNVLMPAYAAIALLFALGADALLRAGATSGGRALERLVLTAAIFQFASLAYDPRGLVPTRADRAAGEALVAKIAALPGDVLIPAHGYLAEMAGKPAHAHEMAVEDVLRGRGGEPARALDAALRADVARRRFGAILLNGESPMLETTARIELAPEYVRAGPLFDNPLVFRPKSGIPARPKILFLARADGSGTLDQGIGGPIR